MILISRENNMALMSRYPDKFFDLAIVDPPYGILNKTKRGGDYKFNMDEYSKWDKKPEKEYFDELFRVSKHQIIWGGNYFGHLWLRSEYNKGFIIWNKNQPETLNNFSMAEMAWCSIDKPSKIFHFSVRKNKNKMHPTQKPVELYEWLLKLYAKPGDKILDTHLGSGTIAIACYRAGLDLTACEISAEYFQKAVSYIQGNTIDAIEISNNSDSFVLSNEGSSKVRCSEQLRFFEEKSTAYQTGNDLKKTTSPII